MEKTFLEYRLGIDSLTVFHSLRQDPVIHGLRQLLAGLSEADTDAATKAGRDLVPLYSDTLAALYPHGSDLAAYIRDLVLTDDNFYVRAVAAGTPLSDEIQTAARHELNYLQDLAALSSHEVKEAIGCSGFLPAWTNSKLYLISDFMTRLEKIPVTGFGIFSEHTFFRASEDAPDGIAAVARPDVLPLEQLYGYERERGLVIQNTEGFLDGSGASNMLLYGDAGTGKSSTIKAVCSAFSGRGLRLVEIKKDQLRLLPKVLESLSDNPLKFILFIDDLSFSSNDDNFSALKAALEGSVSGRTDNVVIYATSNRRHLVKETFSDRDGDELHVNDTLQETMSLADRFGLTVTFGKPSKGEYLEIVRALAKEAGLDLPESELFRRAEAHALRRNGRSPRTAKQLVELLKMGM